MLQRQVQTLHDLSIALRPLVLTTIIQSASLATVECNAHAYVRYISSLLRISHFEQGRLTTWSSKRHSHVNLRASVLYLKPSTTTRVTVLELVRALVNKQLKKPNRKFRKLDLLLSSGRKVERHQPKGTVHWLHGAVSCASSTSVSARQEITRTLWKPEVHYNPHNSPPFVPVLSQINPVHALPSYSFSIYWNTVLPLTDICAKLSPNSTQNCSSVYVHLYTELGSLY